MSTQNLRAEICRPGILLQLHRPFQGEGARCPPKCSLSLQRLLSAMSILRERLPSCPGLWAPLPPGSVEALTLQGIRINHQPRGGYGQGEGAGPGRRSLTSRPAGL